MENDIKKYIEHQLKIERELQDEYLDDIMQASLNGDKIKAQCHRECRGIGAGKIMAYEEILTLIMKGENE